MISLPVGELQVDADLQLVVDGVPAQIVSDGHRVTLSTQDAGRLLAHVLDTAPGAGPSARRLVATAAAALDEVGLSAVLQDHRGTVLELGRGCGSTLGRVLLGSKVRFGPIAVPAFAGVARSSTAARRHLYQGAGAVALAGLVVTAGLRRSSRRGSA